MDLTISGVPGSTPIHTLPSSRYALARGAYDDLRQRQALATDPACALLGRMEGQDPGTLAVPLPHIGAGDQQTTPWSRRHACFHFETEEQAWFLTVLGGSETLLNGRAVPRYERTRLVSSAKNTLQCGGLTLTLEWRPRAVDLYQTVDRLIPGGVPLVVKQDPHATVIRKAAGDQPQPVMLPPQNRGGNASRLAMLDPVNVDSLVARVRSMLEQTRSELSRATIATQELQQRRISSETARDEVKQAISEIKNAPSREAVLSAAARASEAAARAKDAVDRGMTARTMVQRASEQAEKHQRNLRELVDELGAAAARLDGHDPRRSQHDQQAREAGAVAAQAERTTEQARDRNAEAERAFDAIQAAMRMAVSNNEQAQTLASEQATIFLRRERLRLYLQRYALIGLTLVVAVVLGLAIGWMGLGEK